MEEILAYDKVLKANYDLYQLLLNTLTNRHFQALSQVVLRQQDTLISTNMSTGIKMFKNHLSFIKNSFVYLYNNGRIEGISNKIKVLNRVAYGYRNFINYKNRILSSF
ncbi:transposase [Virgibacillus sp. W0430]|uniref:transposase n=1 Tax=Virgibacillus sp. W0430 TaxID=3391580 RepID=UPI003F44EB5C